MQSWILGIAGAVVVIIGVFLPSYGMAMLATASVWDMHPWTAGLLLVLAGFALFVCGGNSYKRLVEVGLAATSLSVLRLLTVAISYSSQLAENAELAKREPGWAKDFALLMPHMRWPGWTAILAGSALILIAGLRSKCGEGTVKTGAGEHA